MGVLLEAKRRNMHADKKAKKSLHRGRGHIGKVAVMGLLERNSPERASRIKLRVVKNVRRRGLHQHIKKEVTEGSEVFTDALASYTGIGAGIHSQSNRPCRVLRLRPRPYERA